MAPPWLLLLLAVANVYGQNLACDDSNLVGFNEFEGNNITTTYCGLESNLELCPPMEIVTQTIGVDNPVVFVTCRVQEGATVSVRAECSCGMEFKSKSERCSNSSTASPGLNIVYVTPEINNNLQVTAYIENFNLTDNRTILIQCIVRNASLIGDNNITGIFNATIQYETSGDNDISIAPTDDFPHGAFVQCPVDVTVNMGSVATFTCQIDLDDYDGIFWYATEENTPHHLLPPEYGAITRTYDLPNNILSSILTINARETTNNTRVLCKGDRFSGKNIYSTAYMMVVMDSDAVGVHTTTGEQLHTPETKYLVIYGTSFAAVALVVFSLQ